MTHKMKMSCACLLIALCATAQAQEVTSVQPSAPEVKVAAEDSLIVPPSVDSTYVGKDIFSVLPSRLKGDSGSVTVHQDPAIQSALHGKIENGGNNEMTGYRIRIYFSNGQKSREESLAAVERFSATYPHCPVYRSYASPNFKVTAGDFRTRSEALAMLNSVRYIFPSAFIVKETIKCF